MSEDQGRLSRLWARIRGRRGTITVELPAGDEDMADASSGPEPAHGPEDESWIEALMEAVIDGVRIDDIGSSGFWKHIGAIYDRGDELLAAQWLEKFLAVEGLPEQRATELRLHLVDMFDERGNLQPAMGHLEDLAKRSEHAARAHYMMAEHHRRRGDELRALREYEAVLAIDVDYPNVRARLDRLRSARGQAAQSSLGETLAGPGGNAGAEGNRYFLVRELGRGASGVVYVARDIQLEREVAVKLLHPHLAAATRKRALRAFFEEARVAASLRHPNIVAILDLDESARRIVMELCGGGTLRNVLRDRGPSPLRRALEHHAQLLSALDAAHARGIVHRDIKPANLMFRRDPAQAGAEIVLADFGIAHLPDVREQVGEQSNTGDHSERRDLVGTLAYMAPEQRQGRSSAKSDLYASAVVLFESITGRYPWSREQLLKGNRGTADFQLGSELHQHNEGLAKQLQAHLDALGHPSVEERPDTTSAMKQARRLRDEAMLAYRDGDPVLDVMG